MFEAEIAQSKTFGKQYSQAVLHVYDHAVFCQKKRICLPDKNVFPISSGVTVTVTREDDGDGQIIIHLWVRILRHGKFFRELQKIIREHGSHGEATCNRIFKEFVNKIFFEMSGDERPIEWVGSDDRFHHFILVDDLYGDKALLPVPEKD